MSFYFCVAVLFVPAIFGVLADNNEDPISNYSRSAAVEDSGLKNNDGRTDSDLNGYGQDGYSYGQDGFGYGRVGHNFGPVGNSNVKNVRRRTIPRDTACLLPNELKDSEVNCRIYSAKVVCNHTCMFGYTFSEGIQRQMECNYKEDRWTPVPEFESCKPFVDCGLTMGPGGGYTCEKDFMDKGPICEIYCEPYEDKDEVKPRTYTCDIEGKWKPDLPFCATPGSGLNLARSPFNR